LSGVGGCSLRHASRPAAVKEHFEALFGKFTFEYANGPLGRRELRFKVLAEGTIGAAGLSHLIAQASVPHAALFGRWGLFDRFLSRCANQLETLTVAKFIRLKVRAILNLPSTTAPHVRSFKDLAPARLEG